MSLTLRAVEPRQGFVWLRRSFQMFFRKPMAFSAMFLVFLFAAVFAMMVPLAGGIAVMMSLPLLSLGYMVATRSALAGGPVHPGQLIEPLQAAGPQRGHLLRLCAAYALVSVLIMLVSNWVDGGRFDRLQELMAMQERDSKELDELLNDDRLATGLLVRFGLATLLAIPFWHAPALVLWGGQTMAQALFSSTLACWRTKGALLSYVVSWVGVLMLFAVLLGSLFALLGARQLVGVAALPAGLMFTCVFYVSLYFTFADTFGTADDAATPAAQGDTTA